MIVRDNLRVPWIMFKYINTCMNSSKTLGGNLDPYKIDSMRGFYNFINESNLVDSKMHGNKYTWMTKRKKIDLIIYILDMIMILKD